MQSLATRNLLCDTTQHSEMLFLGIPLWITLVLYDRGLIVSSRLCLVKRVDLKMG